VDEGGGNEDVRGELDREIGLLTPGCGRDGSVEAKWTGKSTCQKCG